MLPAHDGRRRERCADHTWTDMCQRGWSRETAASSQPVVEVNRDEAEVWTAGAAASTSARCHHDSGNLRARPSPGPSVNAPRVEQPGVHDLPLVPASCLKIQQRGSRVLQLQKELQRVPAGCRGGIDRLRSDPPIPLLDDQASGFFLLHFQRGRTERISD